MAASAPHARPAPRLTVRAVVLVGVLAVLAVSYASSLRAYLEQRAELRRDEARVAASEAAITETRDLIARERDPAYVAQQARARLGMVRPGATSYVVLVDGEPLEVESELGEPTPEDVVPPAWWETGWESVRIAGDPPLRTDPPPPTLIQDPDGAEPEGSGGG